MNQSSQAERPLGELFTELARETSTLVRQEVQLAKTEMTLKATHAAKDAGVIGAGGALIHAGILVLVAALVIGLGTMIPMWVSALIVGLVVAGAGYALVRRGITAIKGIDPVPRVTVETLKEDKTWLEQQTR